MNFHYRIIRLGEPIKFKCIRCDLCCGTGPNVSLTVFDVIRLSKERDVNPHIFLRVYAKVIVGDMIPFITLRGDHAGRCVFLGIDREGKTYCRVYGSRPLKCRLYPLRLVSPASEYFELDTECPGVDQEDGRDIKPPLKLIRQYSWEIKKHYEMIFNKVFKEGMDPLQALHSIIDELWDKARRENPSWMDPSYLDSLGST